jgi:hypothetical protein
MVDKFSVCLIASLAAKIADKGLLVIYVAIAMTLSWSSSFLKTSLTIPNYLALEAEIISEVRT